MAKSRKDVPPALAWQGADYPAVEPGDYQAVCTGWQGPEWVRRFRRWSLRLEFCLLAEGQCVSAFFALGNDKQKPRIGRRMRFYATWCLANGEPPRKGQRMSLETFRDAGLLYWVRVEYATKDEHDQTKPEPMIYSRVIEVLRVERK